MSSEPLGKGDFVRLSPSILDDELYARTAIVGWGGRRVTREQFGYVTKVAWILGEDFYRVSWINPNGQITRCVMNNVEIEKVSPEEVPEEYMRALALESL